MITHHIIITIGGGAAIYAKLAVDIISTSLYWKQLFDSIVTSRSLAYENIIDDTSIPLLPPLEYAVALRIIVVAVHRPQGLLCDHRFGKSLSRQLSAPLEATWVGAVH